VGRERELQQGKVPCLTAALLVQRHTAVLHSAQPLLSAQHVPSAVLHTLPQSAQPRPLTPEPLHLAAHGAVGPPVDEKVVEGVVDAARAAGNDVVPALCEGGGEVHVSRPAQPQEPDQR
jgi:hypothetical protein